LFGVGILSDQKTESYEWLLETFLEAMGQKHPTSAITDGDHAMARAISSTWPNTDHRLCSWHIEENMVKHLRKEKRKRFRKLIYFPWDVDEFERHWIIYKEKFNVSAEGDKDSWVLSMYDLRHKWSKSFTKGRYFIGMQSNQRSESLNSRLHVHLNMKMTLTDLVQHVEHCVSIMHKTEAALDAVASHTIPFTKLDADPLEINASSIYTPAMFKMVKEEIVSTAKFKIVEEEENAGLVRYGMRHKEGKTVSDKGIVNRAR
jgi:zinc finger SWIM domain-containing protein 3